LTQVQAAALLGLDGPKVSTLVRGRIQGDSLDRLFRFLKDLEQEIEINIRAANSLQGTGDRPWILVNRLR